MVRTSIRSSSKQWRVVITRATNRNFSCLSRKDHQFHNFLCTANKLTTKIAECRGKEVLAVNTATSHDQLKPIKFVSILDMTAKFHQPALPLNNQRCPEKTKNKKNRFTASCLNLHTQAHRSPLGSLLRFSILPQYPTREAGE